MERPSDRDVVELLSALVQIDSVNPSLVPGAAGEGQIARFVADWLVDAGLDVGVHEVQTGRPNAVGRLRGTEPGKSLILNAHTDTVGVIGMAEPFQARVEGDRLFGRGAYDMKAGLAAIMLAARCVQQTGGLHGELIVAGVMDEEYASAGTEALLRTCQADAAIVTEPTGLQLCIAHKGFAWIRLMTRGRAAHGSRADLGVDAIVHMGRVLEDVDALEQALRQSDTHPLVGRGSVHASLIEGGQELSSYPDRCVLHIERRTIPGETPESVLRDILMALEVRRAQDRSFHGEAELLFWRDPFEVDPAAPVVEAVQRAARRVTNLRPTLFGDTPWMDAALLSAAGIDTVVFGPGGEGAHAAVEWVSISEVATCAEVIARTALDYCGAASAD